MRFTGTHLSPASGNRQVFYKPAGFSAIGGAMNVVDDFLQRPETYGIPSASTISIRFCCTGSSATSRWLPAPDLPPQIRPTERRPAVNQAFINPA